MNLNEISYLLNKGEIPIRQEVRKDPIFQELARKIEEDGTAKNISIESIQFAKSFLHMAIASYVTEKNNNQ